MTPIRLALALAEALGVPTHNLVSFTLHVVPDDAPHVIATYAIIDKTTQTTIVERLQRLELHAVAA